VDLHAAVCGPKAHFSALTFCDPALQPHVAARLMNGGRLPHQSTGCLEFCIDVGDHELHGLSFGQWHSRRLALSCVTCCQLQAAFSHAARSRAVAQDPAFGNPLLRQCETVAFLAHRRRERATGMSRPQALRYVIFPQAAIAMVPIFLTQAIILFQDTSLVFVVSLHDFLTAITVIANRDGRLVEAYSFACLIYYLICLAATAGVEKLKRTLVV
jgi:hypothetical protein